MLSVQTTRKRLLNWLRSENPNWCKKVTCSDDGCYCALGYVGKIHNLKREANSRAATVKQYDMSECVSKLGVGPYSFVVYDTNDSSYSPAEAADKLEALFKDNPCQNK